MIARVIIELVGGQSRVFRVDFLATSRTSAEMEKPLGHVREEVLRGIADAINHREVFRIQDHDGRNAGAFKPDAIVGVVVESEKDP